MATVFFQAVGDAVPRKESGCLGKPRGPVDPKSEVVTKRKTNPEMRKKITNFVLEMSILIEKKSRCLFPETQKPTVEAGSVISSFKQERIAVSVTATY